jgi:uncharacterized protein YcnI
LSCIAHSFPNASTKNVTVQIPANVTGVKPRQLAGWTISMTYRKNGAEVDTIVWAGGSLPDSQYEDFGIQMKLPAVAAGTIFYFPTTQGTEPNGTLAWVSIPDASGAYPTGVDSARPSPKLTIVNATTSSSSNDNKNNIASPTKSLAMTHSLSLVVGFAGLVLATL